MGRYDVTVLTDDSENYYDVSYGETIYGGGGDDKIITTNDYVFISGDSGNDEIWVGDFSVAFGGAGDDLIDIDGDEGTLYYGGRGADTFDVFYTASRNNFTDDAYAYIADYTPFVDVIDIDDAFFAGKSEIATLYDVISLSVVAGTRDVMVEIQKFGGSDAANSTTWNEYFIISNAAGKPITFTGIEETISLVAGRSGSRAALPNEPDGGLSSDASSDIDIIGCSSSVVDTFLFG